MYYLIYIYLSGTYTPSTHEWGQRRGRRSIEEEGKGKWGSLEVVMKKNTRRGTYEDGGL